MTHTGRYHGGLIFSGNLDQALDRFTRIVTATFEDYGHPVERQSILDTSQARIVASNYMVKLTLGDAPDTMSDIKRGNKPLHRLEISLCPAAGKLDDKDISELMLVVMLYRMVDIFATRAIEWLEPRTVLSVDQFLGAFSNIKPRRTHTQQNVLDFPDAPFNSVDDTEEDLVGRYDALAGEHVHDRHVGLIDLSQEETLALAYRLNPHSDPIDTAAPPADTATSTGTPTGTPQEQAQSDIRRLAIWGMTGMVAFLSAPVALSMAAVNLVRGEDLRLNTHVLSLTGLLVMLQSSGALASAVSYLPN